MTRAERALVTAPNPYRPPAPPRAVGRLVMAPVALSVAELLSPLNCVWLRALYPSHRNWRKRPSALVNGTFLNMEASKLLVPGPLKRYGPESAPLLPFNAMLTTPVL